MLRCTVSKTPKFAPTCFGSITEDPSSGCLVQCLAKYYKNDSIVSVDMDMVGVMTACCDPLYVCVFHCIGRHYVL